MNVLVDVFSLNAIDITPDPLSILLGVTNTNYVLLIDSNLTSTPSTWNVNYLSKFFGNPVPVTVTLVPPSVVPDDGLSEVIDNGTFSPVTD